MVVAQYLLTFREVLEAALLTAIILAFLVKTNRASQTRYAWFGIYGALGASVGLGLSGRWSTCVSTVSCSRRTSRSMPIGRW